MSGSTLFERMKEKGFSPQHVAEVGVYFPETSNVYRYILNGVRCTLVEPDPDAAVEIKRRFAGRENVSFYPLAVYDTHGTVELARRGASTYLLNIERSPAVVNDRYRPSASDRISVEAVTFDEIDDGTIDLLSVDIEGGEWYVIKHLKSRPAVISLETHAGLYRNPHMIEISAWMLANGYARWYLSESDSIYVRAGAFDVSPVEKLWLVVADVRLWLEKARVSAKRLIRRQWT